MSASQPTTPSPLARLVLFMVCLAIAGTVVAGAHYYTVDLPQRQIQEPPENLNTQKEDCLALCTGRTDFGGCMGKCMNSSVIF